MNIIIHRGTTQIGGCVTEIRSNNDRIIIDLGSNLQGAPSREFSDKEIFNITEHANAVLYTHYHGDHVGLFSKVADGVPQYIGEGAFMVMKCKNEALQHAYDSALKRGDRDIAEELNKEQELKALKEMNTFNAEDTLTFGGISVTPFFCSHSAFDSYMFLIECENKKILHTGDFREHGYLGKGLRKLIPAKIGQVDVLIIEGTMLGRNTENVRHEVQIKSCVGHLLIQKSERKHLFALCSSTDIDRLASLHKACKEHGAWLVCDIYQKQVLDIFSERAGKYSDLFSFDRVKVLGEDKHFFDEIRITGFVMLIRPSRHALMMKVMHYFPDAELIYSMWHGYYAGTKEQLNEKVVEIVSEFPKTKFHEIHTSGHATIATLSEVIRLTNPRKAIIPIHRSKESDLSLLQISDKQREKVLLDNNSNRRELSIE
ncbi:MAG: MBL fold metallo-hydrolase [Bacteroidales bacterium]|jgi:ribonuclease J|nr:MBL fold metallo-hydrolase [Bacteroidales bacterium]